MIVLPDPSATLYELVQGQDHVISVSVVDADGNAPNLSAGYTANFTLYEKLGGGQLLYLVSTASEYNDASASIVLQSPSAPAWINVLIKFDKDDTAGTTLVPVLSKSRRRNNVLLYGDLKVLHSSKPVYGKQLKFSFRQTLQGS